MKQATVILVDEKSIEHQSSYRQIMKATSIFGGVQLFSIIISIIRTKLIAVLLGPSGIGIAALLNSTTGMIGSITNFGLGTSAVKDIAAANATNNSNRVSSIVTVFRKLVWLTGTIGFIVTLVLSPWLSELTFGNRKYTLAFAVLSITLLLGQLSVGQMVVLQGMRKMQFLAKANIFGSALGLLITFPLYFFYKIDAIVPAIIIASIITLLLSWYFSSKIKIETIKVSIKETIFEGKCMLTMGFMINLSILITLGVSYILRLFISHTGGIEQVGLYNSGFSIINMYVAMIFTAMATDYYPRLSSVAESNYQCKKTINQQAEIALLILAPIILVFIVFIQWVVIILYSKSFVGINGMIHWAVLGVFFKAASWSVAFILLAKGASKLFFWSELLANAYQLIFSIIGYKFWGLDGLGISYMAGYIIYLLQVFLIARVKYEFEFEKSFYEIFCIQLFLGIVCFEITRLNTSNWVFAIGAFLIAVSSLYSYYELDKRIGIKELLIKMKGSLIKYYGI